MTWRAFLLGVLCTIGVAALDPYTSFNKGYGWNTGGHFPTAAVFLLVFLTVFGNLLVKLVRRAWALRQSELMLVWCMLIVACLTPCSGMMRLWFPALVGPAYTARRSDIVWRDSSLAAAPDELLVTKDPKSLVARRYFEGQPEPGRLPWGYWAGPVGRWGIMLLALYLAVFLLCAALRRQWVDRERLQVPLARVPLEFTAGSGQAALLPPIFRNRTFVVGIIVSTVFRAVRALPIIFGTGGAWRMTVPFKDVLQDTPLRYMYMQNIDIWWSVIGFAFLVPADVSLSVWLFYLFGRLELQTCSWIGSPLHYGGTWSQLMRWQLAGAYLAFTIGVVYVGRRHLGDIVRKAFGRAPGVDDSDEPVRFGTAFWGFVLSAAFVVAWFAHYGMKWWVAALLFAMSMAIMIVHARIVAQSGMYTTQLNVIAPEILHGLGFGHVFGPTGVVIAEIHHGVFVYGSTALPSPAGIHAFRISEVFGRRKRLLLPVLMATLVLAMGVSGWQSLRQAYTEGASNFTDTWGQQTNPGSIFGRAHQMIKSGGRYSPARWTPFAIGILLTGFVMFMRGRFYWWPVQPIGLVALSSWQSDRLWLPFLLGWLLKSGMTKFAGGATVRRARYFFIALILVEAFFGGVSTIVRTLTDGAFPGF
jgi:hypothetical protein